MSWLEIEVLDIAKADGKKESTAVERAVDTEAPTRSTMSVADTEITMADEGDEEKVPLIAKK